MSAALSVLVGRFITDERPNTLMLDADTVMAQAIAATWFYAGYATINSAPTTVDSTTVLNLSEWALIRPLFMLFIERESAIEIEASRGLGVDVFGRSTSEIESDIKLAEADMAGRAFFREIVNL